MKRSLILMAITALLAVSCGTAGTYSSASRFQDGIYYKAEEPEFSPLSEEEIASMAALGLKSKQYDTLVVLVQPFDTPYSWYGPYS